MKRKFKIPTLTIIILGVASIVFWFSIPMTEEMRIRPGYFLWTKGIASLNLERYQAFTRDLEFRDSLIGEPLDRLKALFPDMSDGSEYSLQSYRSSNRIMVDSEDNPVDCFWLNGEWLFSQRDNYTEEDDFGYCVLVRNGSILGFRWIKG